MLCPSKADFGTENHILTLIERIVFNFCSMDYESFRPSRGIFLHYSRGLNHSKGLGRDRGDFLSYSIIKLNYLIFKQLD